MKPCLSFFLLTATFVLTAEMPLLADSAGKWTSSVERSRHSLTYSSTATLLGQETPITLTFGCDPTWDKDSSGTLGFDLSIKNPSAIEAFPFDSFEGPDAVAAPEVRVTITRPGEAPLTFKTSASGSYSEADVFTFNISEVSKESSSVPRSILEALAKNDVESLKVTIADPANPKLTLDLTLFVAGRQAEFKALLTGLK